MNIAKVYTFLRQIIAYLKSNSNDILNDKEAFIDMRDTFPIPYEFAIKFYNTKTLDDENNKDGIIDINQSMLDHIYNSIEDKDSIQDQYDSLSRSIRNGIDQIDTNMIVQLSYNVETDVSLRQSYVRQLIKSLVIFLLVKAIEDLTDKTILDQDSGAYNLITDYRLPDLDDLKDLPEHINDMCWNVISESFDDDIDYELEDFDIEMPQNNVSIESKIHDCHMLSALKLSSIIEKISMTNRPNLITVDYIAYYTIILGMLVTNLNTFVFDVSLSDQDTLRYHDIFEERSA